MKQRLERCAALGFRVHSGWAALVIVAGPLESPAIVERRRIEIADPSLSGSKQPYHAAQTLNLPEAGKFIAARVASSTQLAREAVQTAIANAGQRGYEISASGVLVGSGKPVPALEKILTSHPLLHTAEGELFRNAIIDACKDNGLSVFEVKERELPARSVEKLRMSEVVIQQHLMRMGKAIGPPWRQDEKHASLAAWMALSVSAIHQNQK